MSYIVYQSQSIHRLLGAWHTLLQTWNDRKAKDIQSKHGQVMTQCCHRLVDVSEEVHQRIDALAKQCDDI